MAHLEEMLLFSGRVEECGASDNDKEGQEEKKEYNDTAVGGKERRASWSGDMECKDGDEALTSAGQIWALLLVPFLFHKCSPETFLVWVPEVLLK